MLKGANDLDGDEIARDLCRDLVGTILETKDGPAENGSRYTLKCMNVMAGIEDWLQNLEDRRQGAMALGQNVTEDDFELVTFQQKSLGQQHELLGAIVTQLIKASHTAASDFHRLLGHLPKLDRLNSQAIHYVPIIIAFTAQFGSSEGGNLHDARTLNSSILDSTDSAPWLLRNLQAATKTLWLAEYSGWYLEQQVGSLGSNINPQEEARNRADVFLQALGDGAFECILSICSHVTPEEWYDPAKDTLLELLLRDARVPAQDSKFIAPHFQILLMEQLETFCDAFITNMPDTIRQFKLEEDNQRKKFRTNLQQGAPNAIPEQILHLERFLIIVSFAYADRPDACQAFWSDTDSNLYGFLQWASRRQSTPCVSAFCEMFRSLSGSEYSATSAHQFLLEESSSTTAKIRRSHTLSWSQIFGELNLYTTKIREQPSSLRPAIQYGSRLGLDDVDEPESPILLQSYLRLMSHLCVESTEARSWVLSQSDFPILEVLFFLCSSSVPKHLQASALLAIQALLTDKTKELGTKMWSTLDQWVSGTLPAPPNLSRTLKPLPASMAEQTTFDNLAGSFEQANQFVALLYDLICPVIQEDGLNDQLPFPETLGSTYRMSGIEPYVDFVFIRIFASATPLFEDQLQERILTWNVLRFVAVCLSTFNEDLVVLANKSSIAVDDAMNASSLLSYVRLHPFARVMEWLFDERVLSALFRIAHHRVEEVADASPNSPLILSLLSAIDVMNLITDLQSTYLDIVRPLVKSQSRGRKNPIFNPSLASFEDSVTSNLQMLVDLGFYSGVGNQQLTISSLKLLAKLSSSRKLNAQEIPALSQRMGGNRMISIFEQNDDLVPIAKALTLAMQYDARELSLGKDAAGWSFKSVMLDFLNQCLLALPDKPTLAHAFLGFSCAGSSADIDPDSPFAMGQSLFHAVLQIAIDYPNGGGAELQSWALGLRQKSLQVLSTLWNSPLTSIYTMSELRNRDFLFHLFCRQTPVKTTTLFDGRTLSDHEFIFGESAEALEQLLWQRCSLLEYAGTEMRLVATEGIPSLKERIVSTMLGLTITQDGERVHNMTIFDLLDFLELNPQRVLSFPQLRYLAGLDFNISLGEGFSASAGLSNMSLVHEMILLRLSELRKAENAQDSNMLQEADEEARSVLLYYQGENNHLSLTSARLQTMKAWGTLITLTINTCELESREKAGLILQALQFMTPKLEEFTLRNALEAKEEAHAILALLFQLDFQSSTLDSSRAGDVANDRLFQLFRTALRAISCPGLDIRLREVLYKICFRYLSGIRRASNTSLRRRHNVQTIKSSGEKTMDIICDDAYGASANCRIAALLFLDSLVDLAQMEDSSYIVELLAKTNFTQLLVEGIENIPLELRETDAKGKRFNCD